MAIGKADAGRQDGRRLSLAVAATLIALLLAAASAQAATITVTNTGDGASTCPGPGCTLRGAIESAGAGDTISLGSGTYTLGATGELLIEKNLMIAGAGAGSTTITTSAASRLIKLYDAELTLTGVTLKGGVAKPKEPAKERGYGGAIYNDYGVLRITGCVFTEDTAPGQAAGGAEKEYASGGEGGAIYNDGRAIITATTFSADTSHGGSGAGKEAYNESGYGGAIYTYGDLQVSSSTFTGDTAGGGASGASSEGSYGGYGGAIYAEESLSVANSTFSANTTAGGGTGKGGTKGGYAGSGGAIYNDGAATVAGSTFSANTASSGTDASAKNYGSGGEGGAIYNDESLTLSASTVSANVAAATHSDGEGGGIYTYGAATINQSTISGNQAPNGYGGGVYAGGSVTIDQSTISGNQAPRGEGGGGEGGGIYNTGYGLQLTASTIGPANTAGEGAGIYNDAPEALTNTTIAGNTASGEGGGIYNDGVGDLANVTLAGNTAQTAGGGGNLYLDYYELTLHDTLIAGGSSPTSGGNCSFNGKEAIIVSEGYNVEDQNQCTLGGPGDQTGKSLLLGPLQNNGGPTATVALGAGSAAIDTGDPAGCTDTEGNPLMVDQRGVARPQNGRCDIGAFEYVFPPVPISTSAPASAPVAPQDTALKLSPSSFAAQKSGASIAKTHHKSNLAQGTTVSYTDSQAASTTFVVVAVENGLRVGKGSCKAPPKHGKRPKHAKGCTRDVTLGSFAHSDVAAGNSFKFTGRLDGHGLVKGSYKLKATPKQGSLSGATVSASFTIL